jgi:hypothetical protein
VPVPTPLPTDLVRDQHLPEALSRGSAKGIAVSADNIRRAAVPGDGGRDEVPHRKILENDSSTSVGR